MSPIDAYLFGRDLGGENLQGTDLINAILSSADLRHADFLDAVLMAAGDQCR
ncbi:MAG: pentapeptide repeat-containing protein [Betaproteobacteria bacterium]